MTNKQNARIVGVVWAAAFLISIGAKNWVFCSGLLIGGVLGMVLVNEAIADLLGQYAVDLSKKVQGQIDKEKNEAKPNGTSN